MTIHPHVIRELADNGCHDAALLLALLERGPRTWEELARAGLNQNRVLIAVGDLAEGFGYSILIVPVQVALVEGDAA
jgi:hypothetical protein